MQALFKNTKRQNTKDLFSERDDVQPLLCKLRTKIKIEVKRINFLSDKVFFLLDGKNSLVFSHIILAREPLQL